MAETIMIVGNGEIDPHFGGRIDAADLVIRFNLCGSVGNGGQRTDVVAVCNTGRPAKAMLEGKDWKTNPAVGRASEIWCVRDSAKFASLRQPLMVSHPELDDFCDDFTDGFRQFAQVTGKQFRMIDAGVHDDVDRALAAHAPADYVVPSSGLVVIFDVLARYVDLGARIVLAGFGHQGWQWHPFAAERKLVDQFVSSGKLHRIHSFQLTSQGA